MREAQKDIGSDMTLRGARVASWPFRFFLQGAYGSIEACPNNYIIGGCHTRIFEGDRNERACIETFSLGVIRKNIGTQLPFGWLFRPSYESSSGPPQSEGSEEK
jgi:hypothetical protein